MKKVYENDEFELYMDDSLEIISESIIKNTLEKFELFRQIFKQDKLLKSKVFIFDDLEQFRKDACKQRNIESIPEYSRGWFKENENTCFLCIDKIPLVGTKLFYKRISCVAHECFHNLYSKYYYKDNRITWFDEGLAQYLSGEFEKYSLDDWKNLFLFYRQNSVNVNNINDRINGDESVPDEFIFKRKGVFEGYAASLLAVRYLFDEMGENYVYKLIFDNDSIMKIGLNILDIINEYYENLFKLGISKK